MTLETTLVAAHVLISVVGLASGAVVLGGLLTAKWLEGWTALFLASTAATSLSGFVLPAAHFLPSHAIAILSLVVLAVAIFAYYGRGLAGSWRWRYVVGAMIAFYFNVFVAVAQAFRKVPSLKALAPTQSEPPFLIAQLVVLAAFVVLGVAAVGRFRPASAVPIRRRRRTDGADTVSA